MEVSDCVDAALTRARQARLPSPWTEAVDFLCFPQKPCTPMLNFFARSGPKIEKIDSLWTGRGIHEGRERESERSTSFALLTSLTSLKTPELTIDIRAGVDSFTGVAPRGLLLFRLSSP